MSKRSRRRARLRYRREVERMLRPAKLRYMVKLYVRAAEMMAKGINEMSSQIEKMARSGVLQWQFNFSGQFDKQREEKSDAG